MSIVINGSGTITGISAGGLPDGCITTDDLANGAATQAKRSEQLTLGTAQASTSGTSIDFTGIPSWVKRVTVMFNGVSTNGTSFVQVRLGTSAGIQSTGYNCIEAGVSGTNATTVATSDSGAELSSTSSAASRLGSIVFTKIDSNTFSFTGITGTSGTGNTMISGLVTLTGTLDRLRITTVNGTDTFDAGSINIMYE